MKRDGAERKDKHIERQPLSFLSLVKDYRFNSVLFRSFFLILIVLFCAFFAILFLVISRMDRLTDEQVRSVSQSSLSQAADHMDSIIQEAATIAVKLSLDDDIVDFLLADMEDTSENYPETFRAKKKLEDYASIFSYIDSIYVYSRKNDYVVTDTEGRTVQLFQDRNWYDNITERIYEPARMMSRMKYGYYPYLISYIQPVRLTQMQYLGGIIVNIDVDQISEYTSATGDEIFLTVDDRDNVIFSSAEPYRMKKRTELSVLDEYDSDGASSQMIEGDGKKLIVSTVDSDVFNWKYIAIVPTAKYQTYRNGLGTFAVRLSVLIVIVSVVSAILIALYSYSPIRHILSLVKDPEQYNPDTSAGLKKDETQVIISNIVRNFYSNHELQEDLSQYLEITNKAQVTALQAQISPHFLYNTLESIRWQAIALSKGDNDVSRTILKLSQLLRISLDNDRPIISLKEEMYNAEIYVEILQFRYKDKLLVEWNIPQQLYNCQIVKVSLQPIIENSVSHGIKPKRVQGVVKISAWTEDRMAFVEVADDGVGMDEETCRRLNEDMSNPYAMREDHIGVRNVNQRLKLLLGEASGIRIFSIKGKGTRVILHFPLTTVSEDAGSQQFDRREHQI